MRSITTAMFWMTGRIRYSLRDSLGPPPPISICCIMAMDCRRKYVKA